MGDLSHATGQCYGFSGRTSQFLETGAATNSIGDKPVVKHERHDKEAHTMFARRTGPKRAGSSIVPRVIPLIALPHEMRSRTPV